jgi:hypothetical protein
MCHFHAVCAGSQSEKIHVFDKYQLNKPYYTLLAVADEDEMTAILHTVGAQAHMLPGITSGSKKAASSSSNIDTSAAAKSSGSGSGDGGSNENSLNKASKKPFAPLRVDVSHSAAAAVPPRPGSLRTRAIAAGCLSPDLALPACSSGLIVPHNKHVSSALPAGTNAGSGSCGGVLPCSPRMMDLLAQLNPMQSFAEIRHKLGIPLGEVSATFLGAAVCGFISCISVFNCLLLLLVCWFVWCGGILPGVCPV